MKKPTRKPEAKKKPVAIWAVVDKSGVVVLTFKDAGLAYDACLKGDRRVRCVEHDVAQAKLARAAINAGRRLGEAIHQYRGSR